MLGGHQIGGITGKVFLVGLLVLSLQGCLKVEVEANLKTQQGCEKGTGERDSAEGCAVQTAVAGGTYPGVTCTPGTKPCLNPGTTAGCRGGKKCTNVDLGGGNCACQCQ